METNSSEVPVLIPQVPQEVCVVETAVAAAVWLLPKIDEWP